MHGYFIALLALQEETPSLFGIDLGVSVWTLLIFGALFFVLSKYAFPPILGYANAREQRIQEALDSAARERQEAQALLEQHRRQLAEARQEAQQIIAEGRQAAERVREDTLQRARAEHEALLQRAREEIERERERAIDALRREAVELSIAAAAKLLGERLGDDQDRRIVHQYLERLGGRPDRAGVA